MKVGDKVSAGQRLCEGNIDLKKLFKVAGLEKTASYIVQEIQKIYASQGVTIHDKHIETIVRQMFARVKIVEKGDSKFSQGEVVEKSYFLEENEKDRKSTRLNSSHTDISRMPSSA